LTTVLVRYFASARAAVGVDQETLQLPAGAVLSEVLGMLRERHPDTLARILEAASFLVDGIAVRDHSRPLLDGSELDVLPPFAGG
jgi:molybdopterin synthase sulfur carrier subunit